MILTLFKNVLFDMKYIYLINHISVEAPINYCDNYIIANQYSTNRSIDRAIVITSNKNDVRLPLPPVVCRRAHVLLTFFVLVCIVWCSTNIVLCFCFVFLRLVYPMLPVSLDCPFWLSLRYSQTLICSVYHAFLGNASSGSRIVRRLESK